MLASMRKGQVIQRFGGQYEAAAALGVSQPAVSKWNQVVPLWVALKVEELTDGELKPDWSIYGFRERKLE